MSIPLSEIEVTKSDANPIIPITDTITVEMEIGPSYRDIPTDVGKEIGFGLIASSIKTVIGGDDRIDVADEPFESVMSFLESMTQEQFAKGHTVFENAPTVKYDLPLVW